MQVPTDQSNEGSLGRDSTRGNLSNEQLLDRSPMSHLDGPMMNPPGGTLPSSRLNGLVPDVIQGMASQPGGNVPAWPVTSQSQLNPNADDIARMQQGVGEINMGMDTWQRQSTTAPGPNTNMAPSPSSLLVGGQLVNALAPPPSSGPSAMSGDLFSNDFIQSVASSIGEFDQTLYRPDGDIHFERDFEQWFSPDASPWHEIGLPVPRANGGVNSELDFGQLSIQDDGTDMN